MNISKGNNNLSLEFENTVIEIDTMTFHAYQQ